MTEAADGPREPDHVIPWKNLPERFARSLDEPPADPAPPRAAATVALLRPAPTGLQVLLLQRNRKTGFVPGAFVFPGGRVDSADGDPALLERTDGLSAAEAARRLDLEESASPSPAAYFVAAAREAFEETGILVGTRTDGRPPPVAGEPRVRELRDHLLEDRWSFSQVLDELGCRIDGGAIEYIAHWITPEAEPRRYDTRFFAAAVPEGARALHDPREMLGAEWLSPRQALERNLRGELPMVFPTIRTLESLAGFHSPVEALETFSGLEIPSILPRLVKTPDGVGIRVPDEEE